MFFTVFTCLYYLNATDASFKFRNQQKGGQGYIA